jgi:putative membrane protein
MDRRQAQRSAAAQVPQERRRALVVLAPARREEMKNKLLILVSGSVLAVSACAKHDESTNTTDMNVAMDNGMAANMGADMNAGAEAAAPMTAQGFANAAAASDKFEVDSSKLAAGQASSAAVKSFADKMISAHTASTAKLKSLASGMNPAMTPDDTLSAEQQATLDSLKGKKGADFDSAYAAAQVDGHQKTLDALKAYAASADNATLKGFAENLVPTVTAHLNMAKGLK